MSHSRFLASVCLIALSFVRTPAIASETPAFSDGPRTFEVLQLNIWQEGTSVPGGLDKIADVVLKSGAQIAAFSEVRNYNKQDWHTKILAKLKEKAPAQPFYGKYVGGDVGLVSRFPITSTAEVFNESKTDSGSIMAYRLELPDGRTITVCSGHLDYRHYALNWVRGYNGGEPDFSLRDPQHTGVPQRESDVSKILAYNRESRRNQSVAAFLDFAQKETNAGRPVLLCGDFNEASHLDWTERAKDQFGHYGVAIPWDNSLALATANFGDGYRTVFPDEVQFPGFSWPATAFEKKTTSWATLSDERDRIDFVYYQRNFLHPVNAWMVGPSTCFVGDRKVENPGKDPFVCTGLPWPSDHKGVLVEFELTQGR